MTKKAQLSLTTDLSLSTPSALDLSLSYHLTKAYLGSLALDADSRPSPGHHQQTPPRMILRGQLQAVEAASASALAAITLVTDALGFRDRITYLPNWYHHMLGHAAGFLLQLCQRKGANLLAGEAKSGYQSSSVALPFL